jgi:predicted O-methyltransferase YrrM
MTEPYIANMAQDETEITEFAALLAAEGVTSYLEIGSKFGGSLWRVANALPKGSRIVAVDMPGGTKAWDQTRRSLKGCVHRLIELGYDARIIWGDSTDPRIIEQVQAHAPFDACLIDANHTLPYVTKDFANYGAMAKIVAFHDLAWSRGPDYKGTPIHVPEFWASIKDDYERTEEIIRCPTGKNNGIGVLWRA